jgi:excisionase family DNA binding protein
MPKTYSVKEVADLLGYSTNSIYTFLKEKRIKGVRLGHGRFRIPQAEVDRLMGVRSTPPVPAVLPPTTPSMQPSSDIPAVQVDPMPIGSFVRIPVDDGDLFGVFPSLFDWFASVSAIVTGASLFLFNKAFEQVGISRLIPVLMPLRLSILLAGVGSLILSFTKKRHGAWRALFFGAMVLVGSPIVVSLWRMHDIDGVLTFAGILAFIAVSIVMRMDGMNLFLLFVCYMAVTSALVPFIAPTDAHVMAFAKQMVLSPWVVGFMISVGSAVLIPTILIAHRKSRIVFWVAMWVIAITYTYLAVWYAQGEYWTRSFFLIALSIASWISIMWEQLITLTNRHDRIIAKTVLLGIPVILLLAVSIIYVLQAAMLDRTKHDIQNELQVAKATLESRLSSAQSRLQAVADDPSLAGALAKDDVADMTSLAKVVYENGETIRRVVLLNAKGDGMLLYPQGTFDVPNLSFREYFQIVKRTKKPYITSVFEAFADNQHRFVTSIVVPVLDKHGEFAGLIQGSLNLTSISSSLQRIAESEGNSDEHIVVVDANKKRVIHKDILTLGSDVAADDPVLLGLAGGYGLTEGEVLDNKSGYIAYDSLPNEHWGIAIKTTVLSSVRLVDVAAISVFGIVAASVGLAMLLMVYLCQHDKQFSRLLSEGVAP